jgi:hypothetical protein
LRLVVADEDDIPGWLYPEAFPEVPQPAEDWAEAPALGEPDFAALWRAADPTTRDTEAIQPQYTHCDVGVPHDAPEWVGRLNPTLVATLAVLAEGERWRVAQAWAADRLGKRPNQGELARHKDLLRALCALAKRSVDSGRPLLLL